MMDRASGLYRGEAIAPLLAIVAWALFAIAPGLAQADALDVRPVVDPLARQAIADHVAVGFTVGVLKEGQTQILGYGETVKDSGTVPGQDTEYEIGSISKVFTGVLLADMVERGLVKLDEPLRDFFPELKPFAADGPPITLEMLATHSSGLPRMPNNMRPADPTNPYADYTLEQLKAFLAEHQLRRVAGRA